jgi:hypothetical protein
VPLGVVVAEYLEEVTLLVAELVAAPLGVVSGVYAIVLARRGREAVQRMLGRGTGGTAARVGRALGIAGLCLSVTAGLALVFYGLLVLFAE